MGDNDQKLIAEAYFGSVLVPINEANVLDPKTKIEDMKPLRDSDTIRVYHGFNSINDLYSVLKYGMSGKDRTKRIHSYEANNNPMGLFVTIDFNTAKKFTSQAIIQFHAKVHDLESPVWPSGTYTGWGGYSEYWKEPEDREKKRLENRDQHSKSKYSAIRDSDRPELAESLFLNAEYQALFTGELNTNSIHTVWLNTTPQIEGSRAKWKRYELKHFIHEFDDKIKKFDNDKKYGKEKRVIFQPRDKFDLDKFLEVIHKTQLRFMKDEKQYMDYIIPVLKKFGRKEWGDYVWPNQIDDAMNAIKDY